MQPQERLEVLELVDLVFEERGLADVTRRQPRERQECGARKTCTEAVVDSR
jgi:hypothetical protein